MLYKVKSKKAISPVIAIIFIVLIAAILTGAMLSWSKSSTKDKLEITSKESRQIVDDLTCSDIEYSIEDVVIDTRTKDFNFLFFNNSTIKLYNPKITILGKSLSGEDLRFVGEFNSSIDKMESKTFSTTSDFNYSYQSHETDQLDVDSIEEITIVFNTCPNKIFLIDTYETITSAEPSPYFSGHSTLDNNIVAYYSFDGNAEDQVGTCDGTVSGALNSSSYGLINQGYRFDGDWDYINLGKNNAIESLFDPGNSFSISFWMYSLENVTSNWRWVLSKAYTSHTPPYYQFDFKLNSIGSMSSVLYNDSVSIYLGDSDSSYEEYNNWNYVVITVDLTNNIYNIYINNNLLVTDTTPEGTYTNYDTELAIGRNIKFNNNSVYDFYGYIDEVGIWERELTQDEVSALYNSGNGLSR
ncbi:MAG: hypothetical protein PHN22_02045 [Candidatus ainarchaeum sp.]|nr:hypothetical protein [Candidatus ainarchaeum sp.]